MRPIDEKNLLADIEGLKKSPWFNADYISDERRLGMKEALDMMSSIIRHSPTSDVEPIRRGKWEWKKYANGYETWECSVCKSPMITRFWYCPNCGAKMEVER